MSAPNPDAPAIWVTRPAPGNAQTADALRAAGHPVLAIPLLEIRFVARPELPEERPAWILFVSAAAVDGLELAADRVGAWREDPSVRVAAIGNRTREHAQAKGWRVTLVPEVERAEALLDALADTPLEGRVIWIPAGNRPGSARDLFPAALTARGARPFSFPVYETVERRLLPEELSALHHARPGAVVLHSPSAAEALVGRIAPIAAAGWIPVPAIAVGPTTAARARTLGFPRVIACEHPSDEAILEALAFLLIERNLS